jgi:hypothetical protein
MKKSSNYYKMYSKYGLEGYYIPVRNTFNNCIEREFIPAEAKEHYEQRFGNDVISDREFLEWYTQNASGF